MEEDSPHPVQSHERVILILVTTSSEEEANKIAYALLEQDLIACANVLPLKKSIFKWEGKITDEQEVLMLLKSRQELFNQVVQSIKQLHSYQVPEIIAIPLSGGSPDYLNWVMANTHK